MSTSPDTTHTLAPAAVSLTLQRAGWKQVDSVPWLWARGGDAVPWEDAVAQSVPNTPAAGMATCKPSVLERLGITRKDIATAAPVVLGVLVDVIPVLVPAAQMLAPPMGTVIGTALGSLGRALAGAMQAKRG